jgi:hypothetical protein
MHNSRIPYTVVHSYRLLGGMATIEMRTGYCEDHPHLYLLRGFITIQGITNLTRSSYISISVHHATVHTLE